MFGTIENTDGLRHAHSFGSRNTSYFAYHEAHADTSSIHFLNNGKWSMGEIAKKNRLTNVSTFF